MLADADVVEVDRRRGFRILRRHFILILLAMVVLGAVGAFYGTKHRSYDATSVVRVAKQVSLSLPGATRTSNDDARETVNETQILQSDDLARKVADILHVKTINVSIAPVSGGDVVDITASARLPKTASKVANAVADAYVAERTDAIDAEVNGYLDEIRMGISTNRTRIQNYSKATVGADVATLRGIAITRIKLLQTQQTAYEQAEQVGGALPAVTVRATTPHADKLRAPLEFGAIGAALGLLLALFVASQLERTRSRVVDATDVVRLGALSPQRAISVKPGRTSRRRAAKASAVRTLVRSILDHDAAPTGRVCVCVAFDGRPNDELLTQVRAQTDAWGKRVAVVSARFGGSSSVSGPTLSQLLDDPASARLALGDSDDGHGVVLGAGAEPRTGATTLGGDRMAQVLSLLRETHDAVVVDVGGLESLLLLANATRSKLSCVVALSPHSVRQDDLARQLEELSAWDVPILAAVIRPARRGKPNHARRGKPATQQARPETTDGATGPSAAGPPAKTPSGTAVTSSSRHG